MELGIARISDNGKYNYEIIEKFPKGTDFNYIVDTCISLQAKNVDYFYRIVDWRAYEKAKANKISVWNFWDEVPFYDYVEEIWCIPLDV